MYGRAWLDSFHFTIAILDIATATNFWAKFTYLADRTLNRLTELLNLL